ncbi:VPLPA-CTERM sorting domain-containing protein [Pseudooceanicola sp. LIPI14-2-Ac024]|uniref:VPLPA-CTERM sorting domain-containing protein n=1 Tax=Pseudooceanicola sp. LIPI14-2-Ac024 TaxID=3344875 RepID=UPI0035CED2BC
MLFDKIPSPVLGAVLLGCTAVLPQQALAQCAPTGADSFECAGIIDGEQEFAGNGLTVTVLDGAEISHDDHTIRLDEADGDDNTLINGGLITSSGGDAVKAEDGFTLENDGEITTTGAGDDGVVVGDEADITNRGTIRTVDKAVETGDDSTVLNFGLIESVATDGDTDAVDVGDGSTVVNRVGGQIIATDRAVDMGDDTRLHNRGLISAGGEAVETGDNAIIKNFATGIIEGVDDALNPGQNVTIHNWGIIRNIATAADEPQDAIDLDSGDIINHEGAEITSTFDAAIDFDGIERAPGDAVVVSKIKNMGKIAGKIGILVQEYDEVEDGELLPRNVDVQHVINTGELSGETWAAVLGEGDDIVELHAGSTLNGGIDLGGDDDTLAIFGPGAISGDYGIFEGGAGEDLAEFHMIDFFDLIGVSGTAELLTLEFAEALPVSTFSALSAGTPGSFSYTFANFELFDFGADDSPTRYTADDLAAMAAVPVPAAGLLLAGGLAGLGALRRRRRG